MATKKKVEMLSDEEDRKITAAAIADPDAVPMTDEEFRAARRVRGPQVAPRKVQVTLRLDPDVLEHFRSGGKGWQTKLNEALRRAEGL